MSRKFFLYVCISISFVSASKANLLSLIFYKLYSAVTEHNHNELDIFLADVVSGHIQGKDLFALQRPNGNTLLTQAVESNNSYAVEKFLAAGAEPCGHCSKSNAPLLIKAVISGQVHIVLALLKSGADVSQCDSDGIPVLVHAVRCNYIMTKLILNAHINHMRVTSFKKDAFEKAIYSFYRIFENRYNSSKALVLYGLRKYEKIAKLLLDALSKDRQELICLLAHSKQYALLPKDIFLDIIYMLYGSYVEQKTIFDVLHRLLFNCEKDYYIHECHQFSFTLGINMAKRFASNNNLLTNIK